MVCVLLIETKVCDVSIHTHGCHPGLVCFLHVCHCLVIVPDVLPLLTRPSLISRNSLMRIITTRQLTCLFSLSQSPRVKEGSQNSEVISWF